jgi:uncharacterized membrane protein
VQGKRGLVAVAICAAALSLLLCGGASAAAWTQARLPGAAGKVYLLGISCPSPSFCVASGTNNLIASSTDPAGGEWNFVYAGDGPWPETENWPTEAISGKQIQGISCPSSGLCVGVTDQGNIYSSTNPTGPASAWAATPIDGPGQNTHLKAISCPTTGLCVAVTGGRNDSGEVWTSTSPAAGAGAWQVTELGEDLDLRGVSCASTTLCVAVGFHGEIVTSASPTGGVSAWTRVGAPAGPGGLQGITCLPGLCVTGNTGGNILTSTAPGANSWKATPGGGSVQLTGAACPSTTQCVVVDNNGDVITSIQASDPHPGWYFDNLLPYTPAEGNALFAASCPTVTFCALAGTRGQILTSTDPFTPNPSSGKKETRGKGAKKRGPKRPRTHIARVRLKYPERGEAPRVEAMVRFYAHGRVRGFQCRVDKGHFRPCRSPRRFKVGGGHHYIRVRAVGVTGLRGPVAIEDFWIGRHHTGPHGTGPIVGCPFPPQHSSLPGCH